MRIRVAGGEAGSEVVIEYPDLRLDLVKGAQGTGVELNLTAESVPGLIEVLMKATGNTLVPAQGLSEETLGSSDVSSTTGKIETRTVPQSTISIPKLGAEPDIRFSKRGGFEAFSSNSPIWPAAISFDGKTIYANADASVVFEVKGENGTKASAQVFSYLEEGAVRSVIESRGVLLLIGSETETNRRVLKVVRNERMKQRVGLKEMSASLISKFQAIPEGDEKVQYGENGIDDIIRSTISGLVSTAEGITQTSTWKAEHAGKATEDQARAKLDLVENWAKENVEVTRNFLIEIAKLKGVKNLRLAAWAGPQGTGKGTNLKAIKLAAEEFMGKLSDEAIQKLPKPLQKLINAFTGKSSELITGTKGMFNRPEGEYVDLFDEMKNISQVFVDAGELVSDNIVMVFTQLMIAKRIMSGSTNIQIDLAPRTAPQKEAFDRLIEELGKQGIEASVEMLDLRLVKPEEAKFISDNRELFKGVSRELGVSLADRLSNVVRVTLPENPTKKQIKAAFNKEMRGVTSLIGELKSQYTKDQNTLLLISEIEEAINRMTGRFNREGRADEMPVSMLTRLRSYYRDTLPGLIEAGAPIVSALGDPSVIAERVVKELISDADFSDPDVVEFIKKAGANATRLVGQSDKSGKAMISGEKKKKPSKKSAASKGDGSKAGTKTSAREPSAKKGAKTK